VRSAEGPWLEGTGKPHTQRVKSPLSKIHKTEGRAAAGRRGRELRWVESGPTREGNKYFFKQIKKTAKSVDSESGIQDKPSRETLPDKVEHRRTRYTPTLYLGYLNFGMIC
jgi:hypothetical protein